MATLERSIKVRGSMPQFVEQDVAMGRRWNRTIRVRTESDKVASKGLALSGFSFGTMVFAMGFFQSDTASSGPLVVALLSSSIVFLMAAELADYSVKFWELFVAELLYTLGAFLLFGGFSWFIWVKFSFFGWSPFVVLASPVALYALLLVRSVRGALNVDRIEGK